MTNEHYEDDLRIQLRASTGTDYMTVANELIGKVTGHIKWRIGSPGEDNNFVVRAQGWGIRAQIEKALDTLEGEILEPEAEMISLPAGGRSSGGQRIPVDSRVRVGDTPWAS